MTAGRRHPDFVIGGAPRSGTTSLFEYLRRHPGIFMPDDKEPRFFAFRTARPTYKGPGIRHWRSDIIRSDQKYLNLFSDAPAGTVTGEASTDYLYLRDSAIEMMRWNPDIRIVLVLRDPVDRAYSNYQYLRGAGLEPLTFANAIAAEPERIESGWAPIWHYIRRGYYGSQLDALLGIVPSEQVHIELFESLSDNAEDVVDRVISFLGLRRVPIDCSRVFNQSVEPRTTSARRLRRVLRSVVPFQNQLSGAISKAMPAYNRVTTATNRPAPEIPTRGYFAELFSEDFELLREILSRTGRTSVLAEIEKSWDISLPITEARGENR